MAVVIEFELKGLPKTVNARLHWRARHRENQKWTTWVWKICRHRRPLRPLRKALLILTRFSSQPIDYDNLASSFKPVTDGLVRAGIIFDDDWETIGVPEFHWVRCPPRAGRICVRVEEKQFNEQSTEGERNAA